MVESDVHSSSESPSSSEAPASEAPPLEEAARRIGDAGKALGQELAAAANALRRLFMAELALSRRALIRLVLMVVAAIALSFTAYLYFMAMGVLILRSWGVPWWGAVGIPAGVSLVSAGLCIWIAIRTVGDMQFNATRRQLARLGVLGGHSTETTSESSP